MEYTIWSILAHQGRSLKWLAARTGYNYDYVRQVRAGLHPVTEEFKRKCSYALDLPVDLLFSLPACSANATHCVGHRTRTEHQHSASKRAIT
jgi:hypothetical protein